MKEPLIALAVVAALALFVMALVQNDTANRNSESSYGRICLDGVVYWRGHRTLAVKYNRDGTVEVCK
jgi:Tfp pilus assembly protein FimT